MHVTEISRFATPIAIAIAATIITWPLRRRRLYSWTLVSIWLAVAAAILAEFATAADGGALSGLLRTADGRVAILIVVRDVLAVNALLQVADLVVWHTLLAAFGRHLVSRLLVNIGIIGALGVTAALSVSRTFDDPDLGGLLVTSTVLSAIIGLALQDMLANVAAGIALQIEAPFVQGDWVRMGENEGEVTQVNWRSLTLRTRENHSIVLPNGKVAAEIILNYSRPERAQGTDVYVGVGYQHPPEVVRRVLGEAAAGSAGVLDHPHPRVFVHAFDDSAITYRVRIWIDDFARLPAIQDGVRTRIWYGLDRSGLTIPFPIRTVRLAADAEREAEQRRDERDAAVLEALRPVPLFEPLGEDGLGKLADGARLERYSPGEAIVRQGADGETMYVVRSGRTRVEVMDQGGGTAVVAMRGPGEHFGEMTLLTGEARSASVFAEVQTEVVSLGRDAFAEVLLAEPTVAESLSDVLARRSAALGDSLAGIAKGAPAGRPLAALVLERIRSIFGLDDPPQG